MTPDGFPLTRQGVRDLDSLPSPPRRALPAPPRPCLHRRMVECHPGCGHLYCPRCGLDWDTYAEA